MSRFQLEAPLEYDPLSGGPRERNRDPVNSSQTCLTKFSGKTAPFLYDRKSESPAKLDWLQSPSPTKPPMAFT